MAGSLASLLLLFAVLAFAVVRPWRLPEAVAAVPAAGIVVASGLVSWHRVVAELAALGPTVGFLAAAAEDGAVRDVLAVAEANLFAAAVARLGRSATELSRRGRPEGEVVACAEADLLVTARDGDHSRLGPRSLGHATRFVVDHAPCRVLLVWPDEPPGLATLPPPPSGPPPPP